MNHDRRVSVIGLGYVGLPICVAFGRTGPVIAFDIDPSRTRELADGKDRTGEVGADDLAAADLRLTTDANDLGQADFHIVTVPTPIDDINKPDLSDLLSATKTVGGQLKKGDIVVFESTVYPGLTEEECVPILEAESGLVLGEDFGVGYSPERINPGDLEHRFETIVKVISANDAETLDALDRVYGSVVKAGLHRAKDIRTAEAAKVIENTQRDLNIAFMNELALILDALGMDTQDVLAAAGTKWNFLPFSPGLVGGHCIGVDPYYLTHRAEMAGYHPQVILAGRQINDNVGFHIARKVIAWLKDNVQNDKPRVTVLGITFKENVPDIRNTKVIDIIHTLDKAGVDVQIHDPSADPRHAKAHYSLELKPFDKMEPADAVVLAVAHAEYLDGGWPLISGLLKNGGGFVSDVRSSLDRTQKPEGIMLHRL